MTMNALLSQNHTQSSMIVFGTIRSNNDPDKLGRVKVEYPFYKGQSASMPSRWARVCAPYASDGQGMWMLPEVGDEVLVFWPNGNPAQPIVLGTLYSEARKPPPSGRAGDGNDNNRNELRYFKTKSGHLLCFDESDDKKGIVLKDEGNRRLEIQSKDKKVVLSDDADNRITLDGKEIHIEQSGGTKMVLKAGEATVETGSSKITLKSSEATVESGPSKVSLSASKVTIAAAAMIELGEGASHPVAFGDMLMTLFNSHTHVAPMGPTSPPMVPMTPMVASLKVKTS